MLQLLDSGERGVQGEAALPVRRELSPQGGGEDPIWR